MEDPPLEYKEENKFTLFDFVARIKESNFAKFVLFVSMMSFAVNIASPFFAVFMLKDLGFNYVTYSFITVTATLMLIFTAGRWGRHADRIGNIKILRFTAPFIAVIPVFWIISQNVWVLFLAQVYSGFLWAGFNMAAANFIYDAVTPGKRTRCISYFNVFNGIAICLGALFGGFILQYLPALFGYKILMLLLISSLARIAVAVYMPLKIKEVRPVEKIRHDELFFSMIGIKPLLGIERKTIRY
jgi:MFS family permease